MFARILNFLVMLVIYYRQAFTALKDNRLRTFLSIMGVTVGIAAVMVVGSVGKGGSRYVLSELETFGLSSLWVYRTTDEKDPHRAVRAGSGIDNADYDTIRSGCCSAVKRVTPIVSVPGGRILIQAGGRYSNSYLLGVGSDYTEINNDICLRGRLFREEDIARKRSVVIIGQETQTDLFGTYQNPLGKDIKIGGRKFMVIGVLKAKSRDFLASIGSSGQEVNKRILVPFNVFQKAFTHGSTDVNVLHAEAVDLSVAEKAAEQIKRILARRHNHRYTYKSEAMAQYITTANKILRGVTFSGLVAASISLFVGGMGIMNIMSTSVVERTREIGLRKAVGARRWAILVQFLFEAMMISGIGGIVGLLLGALIGSLIGAVTALPLTTSWGMVAVALFVSIGVGLLSGYYPAHRAANLSPVEALRHE